MSHPSNRIRILHLIKSLGRGGAETLLPETLKLHDQSRYEFHYLYFLPWKNQMAAVLEKAGGKVSCFAASNNIQILGKSGAVIRYCSEQKIQLIHCHLPWAGMVGRLVHRRTGIPMVYTEHNKQERYHFATKWMNRLTFNWQTAAVAVSDDVAQSIQKNIHPRIPVHEILNGVNTDYFQRDEAAGLLLRKQLGIPDDALVVGTVAVFRFQKRLKEWLEVFHKAYQNNPKLFGIIVGDGPLKDELVQYRRQLGLVQRVIMPGLQAEVKPWYSAMDVFMMTSVFEGLPIALLEAMSMGCAIVTTDAGGIKQVVRNDIDGLVVPVERWEGLAELLKGVVDNVAKRKELGLCARRRVLDAFSLEYMVDKLEALYVSIT